MSSWEEYVEEGREMEFFRELKPGDLVEVERVKGDVHKDVLLGVSYDHSHPGHVRADLMFPVQETLSPEEARQRHKDERDSEVEGYFPSMVLSYHEDGGDDWDIEHIEVVDTYENWACREAVESSPRMFGEVSSQSAYSGGPVMADD